ncbi:MAG: class I SAM-dependent methyltransferase [Candidatus Melainabacteria bacterium]|nr:class I SAM-dependent methyltransferase [Candidatus Melainabacteria bacterium]
MSLENNAENERRDYYSRIAEQYEKCALEETGYKAHEIVPTKLFQLLEGFEQPISVLDLGCGTGLASVPFIERNDLVTGIDFSPGMIEVCRKRKFQDLVCQSINEELAVTDDSFNLTICLGTFEFVENAKFLLEQVFRKLRAGGIFAFTIPTSKEPCERLSIHHFTLEEMERNLKETGFTLVEVDSFLGWETGHLQALDGKSKGKHEKVQYAALYAQKPNTTKIS